MIEITSTSLSSRVRELFSYVTSTRKTASLYQTYVAEKDYRLYGMISGGDVIGIVGVHKYEQARYEIKHIALLPSERGKGYGRKMIKAVMMENPAAGIVAETDREAIQFYEKCGFEVTSLGEKYPGVERFKCEYHSGV
ncbi:GNAT family N-acetyltransferase [Halobacillus locisalis]|uniref:GNAT family N-acetyltransferase n=1 Tax=Halobacillus locisalis TaxID=220753 RepID=A0A838CT64_9BACI|nr:GNAT family N-acetyltransferase [Halobacillus locisalis]MBA2175190.1 GNAT family N-acetyltransferase [Halobacillus locisalis]